MLVAAVLVGRRVSAEDHLTSDEVAAEIVRVQTLADRTAQQWTEADQAAEDLAERLAVAQQRVAQTSADYRDLQDGMARIAIARFTQAGGEGAIILLQDPRDALQADVLRSVALDVGADDLDDIDALRDDLEAEQATLDALSAENARLQEQLVARADDLSAQLTQLGVLREQLRDAEVRAAYERQLAAQRREEDERRAAAERDAAQQAAAQAAAITAASPGPKGNGVVAGSTPPATNPPSPPAAPQPPAPTPAPVADVADPDDGGADPDDGGADPDDGGADAGDDPDAPEGTAPRSPARPSPLRRLPRHLR